MYGWRKTDWKRRRLISMEGNSPRSRKRSRLYSTEYRWSIGGFYWKWGWSRASSCKSSRRPTSTFRSWNTINADYKTIISSSSYTWKYYSCWFAKYDEQENRSSSKRPHRYSWTYYSSRSYYQTKSSCISTDWWYFNPETAEEYWLT